MTPLEWLDDLVRRDGVWPGLGLDQLTQLEYLIAWIDRHGRTDFGPAQVRQDLRHRGGYFADSRDIVHLCRGLTRLGMLEALPVPKYGHYPRFRVVP